MVFLLLVWGRNEIWLSSLPKSVNGGKVGVKEKNRSKKGKLGLGCPRAFSSLSKTIYFRLKCFYGKNSFD
jgi:hypothetical protein